MQINGDKTIYIFILGSSIRPIQCEHASMFAKSVAHFIFKANNIEIIKDRYCGMLNGVEVMSRIELDNFLKEYYK